MKDHKAKLNSKAYQDDKRKAKESILELGTHVLCREPKKKRGLSAAWQGPYLIKKRLGLATYLLDVGHGRTKRRHINALELYQPAEVNLCSLITALDDKEAVDGIKLESFVERAPPDDNMDNIETDYLTREQRQQLEKLLDDYKDIFNDIPGPADFQPYHLDTGQHPPVSQAPYRPGLNWKDKVREAVDKLLSAGFVRPSKSPWSSLVITVPKRDGCIRLVVDYRGVNKLTQGDRWHKWGRSSTSPPLI